jgi:hypothetical protein
MVAGWNAPSISTARATTTRGRCSWSHKKGLGGEAPAEPEESTERRHVAQGLELNLYAGGERPTYFIGVGEELAATRNRIRVILTVALVEEISRGQHQ